MGKPKTKSKASASKKSPKVVFPLPADEISATVEEEPKEIIVIPPENNINVCISSISNIKSQLVSQKSGVRFRVQFGDDFVSDSHLIDLSCYDDSEMLVNWQTSIPCSPSDLNNLDFLTATPVLVSVSEEEIKQDQDHPTRSTQKLSTQPPQAVEFNAFAYCTLDLLPLILGEPEIYQTLLLEIDRKTKSKGGKAPGKDKSKKDKGSKNKTSKSGTSAAKEKPSKSSASSKGKESSKGSKKGKKGVRDSTVVPEFGPETLVADTTTPSSSVGLLPLINVCVTSDKPVVQSRAVVEESNMVFLTVGSVYNLPKHFDAESMEFQAGSLIPNEFEKEQAVTFGQGFVKKETDRERIKRWINIDHIPGKSQQTHYKMAENLFPVQNKLGVDLCKIMNGDETRVEWNRVRRSWLSSSGTEYLGEYISKHKTWLLEILITPKDGKKKQTQKANAAQVPSDILHLVAFFDVSKLLHPGINMVRAACQLMSYCKEDVEAKCGPKSQSLLSTLAETVRPETKDKGKSDKAEPKGKKSGGKKKSEKQSSKATKKGSKASKKSTVPAKPSTVSKVPAEAAIPCVSKPWLTEDGQPVFVVVELELKNPINARKSKEDLLAEIANLIPVRPKVPEEVMKAKKAGEEHTRCIRQIARTLTKEYPRFVLYRQKMNLPINVGDQNTKDFYQYLKEKGIILSIKKEMAVCMHFLIKDKLGYNVDRQDERDCKQKHKFVSELYVRLFEEVNTILNKFQGKSGATKGAVEISSEQITWFEQEAYILGCHKMQKTFFEERMQREGADVLTRVEYSAQCKDLAAAIENTREILMVEKDNKEVLLLYAILLTKKGDTKTALLFFQAVFEKYPRFVTGGFFFYLFYLMTGNPTAAEVVWETSRQNTSFSEERFDSERLGFHPQPLDWDPFVYSTDSIYMVNVVILLRIRFFAIDFAYLALAEELKRRGPSEAYYYYLTVCYYRANRFEDACTVLTSLLEKTPRANHIRRLLGHCQFAMGDEESAIKNYQFVFETSTVNIRNHLVHLRLGDYYVAVADYQSAKAVFMESCISSPTARSWLGVGIACYFLEDYRSCELALTEANFLDRTMPIVWGYLTLVNLRLYREVQYEQCYCRAVRYHLEDEHVLKMIDELSYACGYGTPKLIHSKNEVMCCDHKPRPDGKTTTVC